jgi:hypothetical protein
VPVPFYISFVYTSLAYISLAVIIRDISRAGNAENAMGALYIAVENMSTSTNRVARKSIFKRERALR